MTKSVVITGITGQDGSLMADYLLKNTEHIIYGVVRRLSVKNETNIRHLIGHPRIKIIEGDIMDPISMSNIVKDTTPDYFINLAANSFVGTSWEMPVQVFTTNTLSVLYQLDAIRKHSKYTRYYHAGSSEELGDVVTCPQDETHPLRPRSPYGASKAASRHIVKVYRESYHLYAVAGILFNHEGVRRGEEFVTRKITKGVGKIHSAISQSRPFKAIELGNVDAKRDWSDAEDFVDGIWRMLNQEKFNKTNKNLIHVGEFDGIDTMYYDMSKEIREYVLSSNETHTVREFIEIAFKVAGIDGHWEGSDLNEKYVLDNYISEVGNTKSATLVSINKSFYRPAEVDLLLGNSTKIRTDLGWFPKTSFKELVRKMVTNDITH